ncbi:MAG: hypothetical protein ACOC6M_01040 [Halobacteriota archaeon]
MVEASNYIRSSKEKENLCLFCGEPVEYGWVSDYKGTKVWICRKCVLEGEVGSLMATAILDKDVQDSEILEDISRCLETTQMKLYKKVLYYTFEHPAGLHKVGEGVKERIEAVEGKKRQSKMEKEEKEKLRIESAKVEPSSEKEMDKLDEDQLLSYLDDWKSIRDIQRQFGIGYKPLLEKLDQMYRRGKVYKEKVRIETGGHKYKYKKVSEEEGPNTGGELHETHENHAKNEKHEDHKKNDAGEVNGTRKSYEDGSGPPSGQKIRASDPGEMPSEDQLLSYLDDWKSIRDIQRQFGIGYKPLLESLNRLFFRGYLLKKTVPDDPMFKRAVGIKGMG